LNHSLVVKGGVVVSPDGRHRADVAVSDGRVVAVGDIGVDGKVIDASGLLVLPGMVDTHVHLMEPGQTDREDFPTGTAAAAVRGVTTIVEHTHAHPVRRPEDLAEKRSHLMGRANVDFGLAAHLWPEDIPGMAATWTAGVTFFKMFTCTTHGVPGLDPASVDAALRTLVGFGGRALIHCEDESLTALAEKTLRESRRVDPALLTEWRSREAELVAVAAVSVLALTSGAAVTLAHVSNPLAAGIVSMARRKGADLAAEACPQYFALNEDEVMEWGPLRKFTPPARIRTDEERQLMWETLREGIYSHIATDHAPSTLDQKSQGDIWSAPFGLPGLDTTLPFFLDAALSGKIEVEDVVRLYSNAPARRYGLFPEKGSLEVGSDADFVLVDPEGRWEVRDEDIVSKAAWSPFTGRRFQGSIVATYLRGRLVAENGRPSEERTGLFIPGPGVDQGGVRSIRE
jgi:dihydroorotase